MTMKTIAQVKEGFRQRGETIPEWSKKHGFKVNAVRNVIYGKAKGNWGASHDIALLLGLKDGISSDS